MIPFTKPANLNGKELREELNAAGVNISDDKFAVVVDSEGILLLDIDVANQSKAEAIVAAHNGTIIAPALSINDKLASVGLNVDELKIALGLI